MQSVILAKLRRCLSEPRGQAFLVVLVLAISLILRVFLFRIQGCQIDQGLFKYWYDTAAEKGLYGFYNAAWSDYPPFNIYIFWLFGKLAHAIGPGSLPTLLKLPQNLLDLGTAYLIFRFLRSKYSFNFSLAAMAVYAFNPATIFNLAVWGQMDSIYTFFIVASLFTLLRSRYELSGGLLSLAILTKPQSVIILPVVAYVILRNGGWKHALTSSAVFSALVFLIIIPFRWDNPVSFLYERYSVGYSYYHFNSINTYNFWALLGFWKDDTVPHLGLTYQMWGVIAFVIFAAFVMWQLHRRPGGRAPVFAAFLLMFGFFMLMTRMHERYLFPLFALLALGFTPRFAPWLYIGLTGTYFANLAYVLSNLNSEPVRFIPDGHWSIYVLVPINAVLFFYAIWNFCRMQRAKPSEAVPQKAPSVMPELKPVETVPKAVCPTPPEPRGFEEKPPPPAPKVITPWSHGLILAILAIVYLSVSVCNLGDRSVPSSDWVPQKDPEEVYLDLGTTNRVDKIFLLLQDANLVDMDLYWGSPGNWSFQNNLSQSGAPRQWKELYLGRETRYVRLLFKGASGRIGEVALFSDNHKLAISKVLVDGNETAGAALIDEQSLIDNPESHKSGTYFDEIYFVRTAEETLKLQEPSERTHPPMSKLIIAANIAVFGHDPFAWRIAGVIFATLMILLIYLFAKRMFGSSRAGLIAAFLLTFDFMHFAQARLATGETFILFFVMAMFYFFYRYWQDPSRGGKYLFLSLVFFGFGFATKWITMYGFVGLVLLLIILKWRKPIRKDEVFWFLGGLAAAVAIYMLSYIPYFLAGHGLKDFWDFQLFMYRFHSGLTATHPFTSAWWTWPLMLRPLWIYFGDFDQTQSYISTMGNPAIWWASIPAIIATLWLAVRHKNKLAIFIVVPFLTQWLFYIPIGRVLFIYHFYANVLFMILAITLWLGWLWDRYNWGRWAVAAYLALNVACFAFFFPFISGLPMTQGYWNTLHSVRDWVTQGVLKDWVTNRWIFWH